MSNFVVSARKYRPGHFDSVVGQPAVSNTLKNAIRTGQVAHAYLFCGPRGVGKTTCARIFAKTLNCFHLTEQTEACDQCESCVSMAEGRSFNIHELDAASNNSVEDIRNLIDQVRILPQVGRYSIYIIDEVHMLSQSAFNAFLKTLEEPPDHAIFILATTEKHKIIPTILSRCQIFDFHRIRVEDIVAYLANIARLEQIEYEEEALNVIALKADGALRDALSIFDQVASFSHEKITYGEVIENLNVLDYEYYFRITQAFLNKDTAQTLLLFDEILQRGFDALNFLGGLSAHFRDLLVCHDEATLGLLEVSDALKIRYRKQAELCEAGFLFRALEICEQSELSYKSSKNQRLHIEIALIRLSNLAGEKKNLITENLFLEVPGLSVPGKDGKKPVKGHSTAVSTSVGQNLHDAEPSYKPPVRVSIKDALKTVSENVDGKAGSLAAENEDPIPSDEPDPVSKPLSPEFLGMCWIAFADQLRTDRPRMAVTLKSVKPIITGNDAIRIELNNNDQLEEFNTRVKAGLESFLRREMQHPRLVVDAGLQENLPEQGMKLYTSEEKFQYLSQKNPVLSKFRQELNLELE